MTRELNEKRTKGWQRLRREINIVIYGTSTRAGRLFDLVLLGVILLSIIVVMLETVSAIDLKYHSYIRVLEWMITIFFTVEYILRVLSVNKPLKYIFSFYGIVDLLAVLPMYLSLFVTGTSILSIVRTFRLVRLFKILNHPQFTSQSIHLRDALYASRGKILVFMYFVLITTVIIGSLMYVIEGPEHGFTSIPTAIYWTIVTLTTVGYGDISPGTPLGQFLASFAMIMGYGIIAVPTGIVTANVMRGEGAKKRKTLPCPGCGMEDHLRGAKYCHNCGEKLH